ncbi:D-lactate dehydrogenase [cytochrome], mitochondrial -like protein [Gossypium arboreum]|uniref:D-lactate dehydrogenase [cytochrome], mitochondrial-like protein n=1 Tax=Gossypium arboreum TaxID=29729 RepID=A0A0B0N102_GOSAR|nr:D-lactate dehydrogenase [cytochrome], mitochondrial -like protein [Gossypium arboreum]
MYWDWKFSNLVSLLFLGFALFLYFQFHTYPSPSSPLHIDNMAEDASPESIYDFTVKGKRKLKHCWCASTLPIAWESQVEEYINKSGIILD